MSKEKGLSESQERTGPPPPAGAGAPAVRPLSEQIRQLARRELLVPAVVVFVLAVPVFFRLVNGTDPTSILSDHPAHLGYTQNLIRGGGAPPHPLFHYTVALLSFYDAGSLERLQNVAVFVLALALGVRAYLTAMLLTVAKNVTALKIVGLCVALALVMPLPNWWISPVKIDPRASAFFQLDMPASIWWELPSVRWGQTSPNIWHNPTGIFALPFCLLVVLAGLAALERPNAANMALVGGAMVLSLLAKPNYVLAFAPCFGLAAARAWFRGIRSGTLSLAAASGQALAAFGPAAVVLILQYRSAFGDSRSDDAGVTIAPLAAWGWLLAPKYIPFAILLSIAFPLTVTFLYWHEVIRDRCLVLAWAVFAVALGQFVLLAETGKRGEFGNFGWGAVLANQVLFVACCAFLLRQPASNSRNAAFIIFLFHLLSGCVCLARCLFVPSMASAF